jgi:hypothetical protein
VRPSGTLYSYTLVEHQVHPAFPVPHTIVLVALDDAPGVRLLGHLPGRPVVAIGQAMECHFDLTAQVPMPRWRPAGPGGNRGRGTT